MPGNLGMRNSNVLMMKIMALFGSMFDRLVLSESLDNILKTHLTGLLYVMLFDVKKGGINGKNNNSRFVISNNYLFRM